MKQCLAEANASDVSQYYKAARIYNSGLLGTVLTNLGAGGSTHCYASDTANRLTGWSSRLSGCQSGTIEDLNSDPVPSTMSSPPTTQGSSSISLSAGGVFMTIPLPASSVVLSSSSSGSLLAIPTGTSLGSPLAAGSPCMTEGMWNCILSTSFQRCASGEWSLVEELAEGINCTVGESPVISLILPA